MKTWLTIRLISSASLSINSCLASLSGTAKFIYSSALSNIAFYSTDSQPPKVQPVKVYENAYAQRREIFNENRGEACVYMWVNKKNGKRYVGSAKDLRIRLLLYFSKTRISKDLSMLIHIAFLSHGYESFSLHILEYCKVEDLIVREQYYLDILQPEYNVCKWAGSTLGKLHTEEAKKKISKAKSGKGREESNSMFGLSHTAEARLRMSEAKLGKKLSEEMKAKLSAAAKGKKFTEEHKKNLSAAQPSSKRLSVLDLETGVETTYHSIGEAARTLNLLLDSIRANMRSKNKKPYKGRYVFKIIS